MINNSVLDESLGVVNGLGQSLASLARMVGPGFGGILWSISMEVSAVIHPVYTFLTDVCSLRVPSRHQLHLYSSNSRYCGTKLDNKCTTSISISSD